MKLKISPFLVFTLIFSWNCYSQEKKFKNLGNVTCLAYYGMKGEERSEKECGEILAKECRNREPKVKTGKKYKLGPMELKNISFTAHNGQEEYYDDSLHVTGKAECVFPKIPLP